MFVNYAEPTISLPLNMPLLPLVRLSLLRCLLLVGLLTGQATAAELGEPVVKSFIGQPLVADIELVAMGPDEAQNLTARIARPDVFRGANISMSPILNSLRVSVARRDGRVFLHITSIMPVEADYLHLYLELASGANSDVRSALLWLTADPRPSVPLAAKPQEPGPAMPALLHASTPVAPAANSAKSAAALAAAHRATLPATSTSSHTPSPAGSAAHAPSPASHAAAASGAAAQGAMAPAARMTNGPRRPAVPAAVRNDPLFAEAMALAKECEALDARNLALNGQILQLEGRLQHLQSVLAPKAAAKPKATATAAGATAGSLAVAKGVKVEPKKPDYTRWYWIGGGTAALLALIAAGVVLWRRKRGKGKAGKEKVEPSADGDAAAEGEAPAAAEKPAKKPSLWARLRLMWMLRSKAKQSAE